MFNLISLSKLDDKLEFYSIKSSDFHRNALNFSILNYLQVIYGFIEIFLKSLVLKIITIFYFSFRLLLIKYNSSTLLTINIFTICTLIKSIILFPLCSLKMDCCYIEARYKQI